MRATECNAWRNGSFKTTVSGECHELLFGRMYEDSVLECSLFPTGGRVFCIASAGCTLLDLAATGRVVDSVDINPAQTLYVRQRLSGSPIREGAADRMLHAGQELFRRLLPDSFNLGSFLAMTDPQDWHALSGLSSILQKLNQCNEPGIWIEATAKGNQQLYDITVHCGNREWLLDPGDDNAQAIAQFSKEVGVRHMSPDPENVVNPPLRFLRLEYPIER